MADLYNGIAGSPITYLAADISANQTTISIADDSALPDAPNICTIGYGEQLETIKYGVKSNGVLQEVVRGIEGTPRAWQAGTEVARFFTAYDHNAIIDDFIAHKAEYANLISWDDEIQGTLKNGWTGSIHYQKNKLGLVTLGLYIKPGVTTPLTIVATLPYAPIGNTVLKLVDSSGNSVNHDLYLHSNGNIYVAADSSFVDTTNYNGVFLFKVVNV